MNKQQLAERVATQTGTSKAVSTRLIDNFISIITTALKTGDHVVLSGFGRFDTYQRKSRNGRNPQTGALIKIASRKAARFVAGVDLRNAIAKKK